MNAKFSNKFKTALKMTNVPIILLLVFMHIMCMTGSLLNEANEQDFVMDFTSGFGFGSFGALCVVTMISGLFFSFIKQLKVLPFTEKDIKDISLLNIFINIFIFTVVQCAVTALMRPTAMPYFICINMINIAFAIEYVLLFSDKRMYDARAAREDPPSRSQNVKRIAAVIISMILLVVLTTFIYCFAARGSLSKDVPMLIITALSSVIISAVEIFLYMRKKIEF